jgi:hypothetical protein
MRYRYASGRSAPVPPPAPTSHSAPTSGSPSGGGFEGDDSDAVEWSPPGQEEWLEACPHCLLAGTTLTRTQDAHGRQAVTCGRCGRRVEPILIPAPDRGSGQRWGDGYTQQRTPTEPEGWGRPPRLRGLQLGDIAGAIRLPKPPAKPRVDILLPHEGPQRPG